jgi:hypothetical protein
LKNASPAIAPYSTVLPTMMFSAASRSMGRLTHDHAAARKALADIVVGIADEVQRDAMRKERAEGLPCDTLERDVDGVVGRPA